MPSSRPDLPPPVRERAARILADTVGCMIGGGLEPAVTALAASSAEDGPARLLTAGRPAASVARAALVNGTAAVALELDGCAGGNGGHVAAHVVPAALAVAQAEHSSGTELLTALVRGYEVAARLGDSHVWHDAVHGHGHVGTVGAAVAVATLRGHDPDAAARVAGGLPLATTQQTCLDGATVRDAWVGVSAALGVLADELASAGFTGSGPTALGQVLGREVTPPEHDELAVMRHSVKLHAACFETHAALEAALAHGVLGPEEIAEVEVAMPTPYLVDLPNGTTLSNRFSVPYGVATALVLGRTGPAAFGFDARVMELARRVRVVAEPMPRLGPDSDPARVTVRFTDGREATHRCDLPAGHHPAHPTDDVLRARFPGAPEEFDRLLDVASLEDVSTLLEPV